MEDIGISTDFEGFVEYSVGELQSYFMRRVNIFGTKSLVYD